jgi:hypothetical protein
VARTDPDGQTVAGGLVMLRISNGQADAATGARGENGDGRTSGEAPAADRPR